ncbi:fumarylacetoacetate hydrolase family protein [Rhizobium sp. BR 314]|uniref:fumarylacetoacetate hydrolase family protein n=1 Tax=Rhizobium sp. BR 314 TaxID=3040013 RepID=UPI0039BEE01F
MSLIYRLATVSHRSREFLAIEVNGTLYELALGYEAFKAAKGRHDFFKARHNYTMLDLLEEWDLFDAVLDEVASFLVEPGTDSRAYAYAENEVSFLPPIHYPDKVLNAGSNFYDHSKEMGAAPPDTTTQEPYFFYKGRKDTLIGHGDNIRLTPRSGYVDWEAELAVVIGRKAKRVDRKDAYNYIAGYTCYNDVSARDRMRRSNETFDYDWFSNKGNDTFGPIGPYILPRKFMPDTSDINIKCTHNGDVVQSFSTKDIIFDIPRLVETASSVTTLNPGDVIACGTGAGAGMAHGIKVGWNEMHKVFEHMYAGKARLLNAGDTIAVEIEGIGRLQNQVLPSSN